MFFRNRTPLCSNIMLKSPALRFTALRSISVHYTEVGMGLKLIKDGGVVRRKWYGQYKVDGGYRVEPLQTPMRGERIPSSLAQQGDEAFERSRAAAQREFDDLEREAKEGRSADHLIRHRIERKIGKPVSDVRISELATIWRNKPRSKTPTEKTLANADHYFAVFADFAKCRFAYQVTKAVAGRFFNTIRGQYSWNTTKEMMSILNGAFALSLDHGVTNPFEDVMKAIKGGSVDDTDKVHRRPLSEAELQQLLKESEKDPMLHALTVTAACTGMRIGDVCNLKWSSVDMRRGFLTVLTAKRRKEVTIPILAPLRKILEAALVEVPDGEPHVFPDAAQMYESNPSGIIRRGKVLFARALFASAAEQDADVEIVDENQSAKTPAEVLGCIRNAGFTKQKTERCEKVYTLYATGLSYRQIEHETGLSRGQIADYLHGIEAITGNTIVKWAKECATSNHRLLRHTRQGRKVGRRSASLYGWHSLRASFVVAALMHGVPIEVVRRVVGHSTVRMTEEYFNPSKDIIAEVFDRKMKGSVLTGGSDVAVDGITGKAVGAHPSIPLPVGTSDGLAAMVARMSPEEREQLKALLG